MFLEKCKSSCEEPCMIFVFRHRAEKIRTFCEVPTKGPSGGMVAKRKKRPIKQRRRRLKTSSRRRRRIKRKQIPRRKLGMIKRNQIPRRKLCSRRKRIPRRKLCSRKRNRIPRRKLPHQRRTARLRKVLLPINGHSLSVRKSKFVWRSFLAHFFCNTCARIPNSRLHVFVFFLICRLIQSLRLVVKSAAYQLVLYWTTLQVGIRNKATKRQIWCTTVGMPADFETKIKLSNFLVPCPCFFCKC